MTKLLLEIPNVKFVSIDPEYGLEIDVEDGKEDKFYSKIDFKTGIRSLTKIEAVLKKEKVEHPIPIRTEDLIKESLIPKTKVKGNNAFK